MRNAETILNIIRKRGQRGLPVQDAYRLLYQRDLYLRAYGKLYRNKGAMTEGATPETVDGMSFYLLMLKGQLKELKTTQQYLLSKIHLIFLIQVILKRQGYVSLRVEWAPIAKSKELA